MKNLTPTLFVILAASALLLNSCKEDEDDGLDQTNWGYVKEYYTEKPIANAMVVISGSNPMWAIQDTLYTDSNGRYEFERVKYTPEIQASASGYLTSALRVYAPGDFYTKYNRTIFLYQPAEMVVHVKNVKPFNGTDIISLSDFFAPQIVLVGDKVDTVICCLLGRRYTEVLVGAWVTKNEKKYSNNIRYTPTQSKNNIVEINY